MKKLFLLGLYISVVCISCSSPTSVCTGIIKTSIQNRGNGYIQIDEFNKTDAVKGQAQGIEYYQIDYTVKVKCIKDGGWLEARDSKLYSFDVWPTQCQTFNDGLLGSPSEHCHQVATKVGDVYVYTGSMTLTKHEDGWQQEKNNF